MLLTDRQLGMWRSCLPAGQLAETQSLAHTALKVEEQRPKNSLKTTPKPQQKVDSNPYQLQAGCPSGLGLLSPGRFPKELCFLPSPAAGCFTHFQGTFHQFCGPKNFFPQVQDVADSSLKATLI